MRTRVSNHGFTLVELIAVIVVLAILAGVALPKVLDIGDDAKESAADGTIAALQTALHQHYVNNRATDAPSDEWVTTTADIAITLQYDELPGGLAVNADTLVDQYGATWDFTPETASDSARLTYASGPNDANNANNGSGNGGSFAN